MPELLRGVPELASHAYTMGGTMIALAGERMGDCDTEAEFERMFRLADCVCHNTGMD